MPLKLPPENVGVSFINSTLLIDNHLSFFFIKDLHSQSVLQTIISGTLVFFFFFLKTMSMLVMEEPSDQSFYSKAFLRCPVVSNLPHISNFFHLTLRLLLYNMPN